MTNLYGFDSDTDVEDENKDDNTFDSGVEQLLQAERWSHYEEKEIETRQKPPRAAAKPTAKTKVSGMRVIEQNEEGDYQGPFASFYADELIVGTPTLVKSGKEATVYCCQTHPRMKAAIGHEWLGAKLYRARENRSFKNYSVYQQGRTTMNTRLDKAIAQKSAKGLAAQFGLWIGAEYETLSRLYAAGADVPRPYAQAESAILFDYYGNPGMAAPQLQFVKLRQDELMPLFAQMKHNLALCMECDRVHGDLSPYNILYWEGELKIIDFPQAVDPMDNPDAYALFARDVANVCDYFALQGLANDAPQLALSLWLNAGRPHPRKG